MKYHALFIIFEKAAKFEIVVAANYRWRFKRFKIQLGMYVQLICESICIFAHSDQSHSFPPEEKLGHRLPMERPSKTLIRLRRCAG